MNGRPVVTTLGVVGELTCAKCGSGDIHVRWHTGPWPKHGGCSLFNSLRSTPGEHMHHYCRKCGYEWIGATADA